MMLIDFEKEKYLKMFAPEMMKKANMFLMNCIKGDIDIFFLTPKQALRQCFSGKKKSNSLFQQIIYKLQNQLDLNLKME